MKTSRNPRASERGAPRRERGQSRRPAVPVPLTPSVFDKKNWRVQYAKERTASGRPLMSLASLHIYPELSGIMRLPSISGEGKVHLVESLCWSRPIRFRQGDWDEGTLTSFDFLYEPRAGTLTVRYFVSMANARQAFVPAPDRATFVVFYGTRRYPLGSSETLFKQHEKGPRGLEDAIRMARQELEDRVAAGDIEVGMGRPIFTEQPRAWLDTEAEREEFEAAKDYLLAARRDLQRRATIPEKATFAVRSAMRDEPLYQHEVDDLLAWYRSQTKANPRRRKNGSLAPFAVAGLAVAAGAVAYHSQRTPGAAPAAGWKKERLPAGFGKGYRYTRIIDGMKYEIDDEKARDRISLRVGERLERIHPPGTDWGSWPSVSEAQRAAEDDARFHARKNPRRRKNGLLGAVTLLGLGFAGGAYLESEKPFVRRLRERSRGPAKAAREQAERLQREVFAPAAKPATKPTPAPAKRSTATDPAWRREQNQQGKGYSHLRTINGVDYEVWERIYSDGGKAIFLEAGDRNERILAPNGEEDGWANVAAAKRAAEADAKTRKNPRRRK